jgi:8-oxo-dGTP diphosphatase
MKTVEVAVGVIVRNKQVFISKRADKLHQGGKWEFPGGKREINETIEQTLARELKEEIDINVLNQNPLMVIEHDYGDKKVRLDIRIVDNFDGEPHNKEGQISQWVEVTSLQKYSFPDANIPIIEQLQKNSW